VLTDVSVPPQMPLLDDEQEAEQDDVD